MKHEPNLTTIAKLTRAKQVIQEHAKYGVDKFDLGEWGFIHPCGTHACIAGSLAISEQFPVEGIHIHWGDERELDLVNDVHNERVDFDHWGAQALGITRGQALALFNPARSREKLEHGSDLSIALARLDFLIGVYS